MARITRAAPHVSVAEVKERMNNDPNPLYRKRWLLISHALVDPREAKDSAKQTGVSVKTVHTLISTSNRLGIAAVETPGTGGRRNEDLPFEAERERLTPFVELAKQGELTTAAQIKQACEKQVGHAVDETTLYRLLQRHEWRKLVPRPFHPQADTEHQRLFQQHFAPLVEEALQSRDPEDHRPVLNMAQDEACFGRRSTISRSWAPKQIRPLTPRQVIRESSSASAVVAPQDGKMTSLILPSADTARMNRFLPQVSHPFSKYVLVIQLDQAGWHSSQDLLIPENMRLLAQPASRPETNPVEHSWEEIREKAFANRIFVSLDAVIDTLCDQLQRLEDNSTLLHSMTYVPHFRMAS